MSAVKDSLIESIETAMSQFDIPANQCDDVFDEAFTWLVNGFNSGDLTASGAIVDVFDYLADRGFEEKRRVN